MIAIGPRQALRESILAAERRCEEALADLKHARTSLQATIAEGTGFAARRRLRRRVREAKRSAHEALQHWQALGRAYLEGLTGSTFSRQPG
jgi:hypothetical protein